MLAPMETLFANYKHAESGSWKSLRVQGFAQNQTTFVILVLHENKLVPVQFVEAISQEMLMLNPEAKGWKLVSIDGTNQENLAKEVEKAASAKMLADIQATTPKVDNVVVTEPEPKAKVPKKLLKTETNDAGNT